MAYKGSIVALDAVYDFLVGKNLVAKLRLEYSPIQQIRNVRQDEQKCEARRWLIKAPLKL